MTQPDWADATPVRRHLETERPRWHDVASDAPTIEAHRVRASDEPIATMAADVWPMDALGRIPGGRRYNLTFGASSRSPRGDVGQFAETVKRIAYLLINEETPREMLTRRHTSSTKWASAATVIHKVGHVAAFLSWLATRDDIDVLADCGPELLDEYHAHVTGLSVNAQTKQERLNAVWRIALYAQSLPPHDHLTMASWAGAASFKRTGEAPHGSQRQIVDSDIIDPLILWAIAFVRDFAHDILRARDVVEQWAREVQPLTASQARDLMTELLRETNGRMPARVYGGRLSFATKYLAARYGFNPATVKSLVRTLLQTQSDEWLDLDMPTPVPVPIRGRVHDTPWTESIDFHDLTEAGYGDLPLLLRHLQTACFVVIAYLSGARPNELLTLPSDALVEVPPKSPGGTVSYLLNGQLRKGQQVDGERNLDGEPRVWVTIRPGADAARVAASIRPDSRGSSPDRTRNRPETRP